MASVEFNYDGNIIIIQSNLQDQIKDIINKYIIKSSLDKKSLLFLYSGNIINEELKLYELMGEEKKDEIKILLNKKFNNDNNNSLIKSNYIICPICQENIKYKINNYKIDLYECKNKHTINNIFLSEFERTQYIDISKVICNICKENNKNNTYKNEFYTCLSCDKNICPLCKSSHDKSHNIIKYEQKNFICQKHNEIYVKYCNQCKMNICIRCENEHKNHENIYYGDIISKEDENKKYLHELRESIDLLKKYIKQIIEKLKKVVDNLEIYYNINNIINKYDIKNRNYEILQNIKEFNNNNILDDINKINKEININNKINTIIDIYNKMSNKYLSEINIIYDINKKDKYIEEKEDKINIFGSEFVKNNINKCKMIIDNKEYDLKEELIISNYKNNIVDIKLKGIKNITNMSYMFYNCTSLLSLPDISEWDTENVTNMSYMFYDCESLSSLPDISKWKTDNVTNMSNMFYDCDSLSSLPDISKWKTDNVTSMNCMFNGCSSLSSLPDISKWNIDKVTNMRAMFSDCNKLEFTSEIKLKFKL